MPVDHARMPRGLCSFVEVFSTVPGRKPWQRVPCGPPGSVGPPFLSALIAAFSVDGTFSLPAGAPCSGISFSSSLRPVSFPDSVPLEISPDFSREGLSGSPRLSFFLAKNSPLGARFLVFLTLSGGRYPFSNGTGRTCPLSDWCLLADPWSGRPFRCGWRPPGSATTSGASDLPGGSFFLSKAVARIFFFRRAREASQADVFSSARSSS